jgi:glyoxylase-like metal-dependent hydrolase (beta-lactamase superfamily II)
MEGMRSFMKIQEIVKDIYLLPLGKVNAFLLKGDNGLTLIDAGIPGSAPEIMQAIQSIGHKPDDLKTILLSHCHPDHAGSAAALKREVPQVKIYISEIDAPIVEQGLNQRPIKPAPGIMNKLLFRLFIKEVSIETVQMDGKLKDNEILDFAEGLQTIHIPGQCLGQLAFLSPKHGGVLFVADAASNVMGLGWCIGYEDINVGRQSLQKLAKLDFTIACFGHGKPIMKDAQQKFREKWPQKLVN